MKIDTFPEVHRALFPAMPQAVRDMASPPWLQAAAKALKATTLPAYGVRAPVLPTTIKKV